MKIIPLLVVVAVLAGAGYYVWDTQPELLTKLHLGPDGGKASGDAATPTAAESPVAHTLVKCTDSNGNSVYTNNACAAGQHESDVTLKPLQTVHLPTAAPPAAGGGSSTATPSREPARQNAQGALHQKFLPQ